MGIGLIKVAIDRLVKVEGLNLIPRIVVEEGRPGSCRAWSPKLVR